MADGGSTALIVAAIGVIAAPVSAGVNWALNRNRAKNANQVDVTAASKQAVESLQIALTEAQKQIDRLKRGDGE